MSAATVLEDVDLGGGWAVYGKWLNFPFSFPLNLELLHKVNIEVNESKKEVWMLSKECRGSAGLREISAHDPRGTPICRDSGSALSLLSF